MTKNIFVVVLFVSIGHMCALSFTSCKTKLVWPNKTEIASCYDVIVTSRLTHWQIQGGAAGTHPPTGSNSFVFAYAGCQDPI